MSELDPRRHAQRSKHLAAGFSMTHVLKSEPHVSSSILRLKSRLHEFAQSTAEVHLDHWFNYLAFDIIGEVVFSSSFGFLDAGRDLGGSIANNRFLSLYVAIAGFFQNVHRMTVGNPIVSDRKLMPTQHIFDTTLTAIDARQKNPGVRRDVLSLWMEQRAANGDSFSEKELYGCVNMTVGAGADTVSASLQSFFYHIIRHPRMLERVRKEIGDAGLTEDVVSYADAAGLPFLMACVSTQYVLWWMVAADTTLL
jgi:cytochrome P450